MRMVDSLTPPKVIQPQLTQSLSLLACLHFDLIISRSLSESEEVRRWLPSGKSPHLELLGYGAVLGLERLMRGHRLAHYYANGGTIVFTQQSMRSFRHTRASWTGSDLGND